jgi:hypothetical protein
MNETTYEYRTCLQHQISEVYFVLTGFLGVKHGEPYPNQETEAQSLFWQFWILAPQRAKLDSPPMRDVTKIDTGETCHFIDDDLGHGRLPWQTVSPGKDCQRGRTLVLPSPF